jgi:hypothetical protein
MRIRFDLNCLAETSDRLFPASRHRSRRVHKKLIKRYGGEFRKKPAMFRAGDQIIAHPSFRAALEASVPPRPSYERNPYRYIWS